MECLGVPLHAWSINNFRKVTEVWGTVVGVDKSTEDGKGFREARILMSTKYYPYIQGSIYLSIDGCGYDIYVKELGKGFTTMDFSCYDNLHDSQMMMSKNGNSVAEKNCPAKAEGNIPVTENRILGPTFNGCTNNEIVGDMMHALETLEHEQNNETMSGGNGMAVKGRVSEKGGIKTHGDPQSSCTKSLEDERRTKEGLRDLGLSKNGPYFDYNGQNWDKSDMAVQEENRGPNTSADVESSVGPYVTTWFWTG